MIYQKNCPILGTQMYFDGKDPVEAGIVPVSRAQRRALKRKATNGKNTLHRD